MKTQPIIADLTEMVFEGRFRTYGAYRLRKLYNQRLLLATFLGLGLFFAGIVSPNLVKEEKRISTSRETSIADTVTLELIERKEVKEEKKEIILPKIKPPKLPRISQKAFKIPDPKPKDELKGQDSTIASMSSLAKAPSLGPDDFIGEDDGYINIPDEKGERGNHTVIEERKEPGIEDFIFVSQTPEPINMDAVKKLIEMPESAIELGLEGEVVVRILIDEEGNYRKHKVIKKVHPILAEAVEKQIHKLKFIPAVQGNKPIMFWVNVPFRFTLLD